MNREQSLQALSAGETWDVLVIGGGATGLGAAADAASRGLRTALVEARDFAKGTSSRSTKLIHGGVRYLRQGNVALVRDSLRERAYMLRNAPHLSRTQAFIVPAHGQIDRVFYGVGLKMYDALAGRLSLGRSEVLSRAEVLRELPGARSEGLLGGIRYFDGQFDDARFAISLAQMVHDLGGVALNYLPVTALLKENGRIAGALARDEESGREMRIKARAVINATGVFCDEVRRLDSPGAKTSMALSQGAHIVVDESFLPGTNALMVPKTKDGRVLFAIPWQGRVVIGTTDTPAAEASLEPKPLAEEIAFLLEHAAFYLAKAPSEADILSAFAGLRPLVKGSAASTAKLSRDHTIMVSDSGLVTITGGKWTTYRKMGEDVVDRAIGIGSLRPAPSRTREMRLPEIVGAGEDRLDAVMVERFAREQMARTVEDVLARRTRWLLRDARRAIELAPMAGGELARVLGRDTGWATAQADSFTSLARSYLWNPRAS